MAAHMANHLGAPLEAAGQHQVADKHANIRVKPPAYSAPARHSSASSVKVAELMQLLAQGLPEHRSHLPAAGPAARYRRRR